MRRETATTIDNRRSGSGSVRRRPDGMEAPKNSGEEATPSQKKGSLTALVAAATWDAPRSGDDDAVIACASGCCHAFGGRLRRRGICGRIARLCRARASIHAARVGGASFRIDRSVSRLLGRNVAAMVSPESGPQKGPAPQSRCEGVAQTVQGLTAMAMAATIAIRPKKGARISLWPREGRHQGGR